MSNLPHNASHADNDECIGDILIKFNVSSACSTKSSHNKSGQLGSRVARVAIKWSFQVAIARSALLVRCCETGVISNCVCIVASQLLVSLAHSLSIRIISGGAPRSAKNFTARCSAASKGTIWSTVPESIFSRRCKFHTNRGFQESEGTRFTCSATTCSKVFC